MRLLAVLEPDAASQGGRLLAASPISSARSTASNRQGTPLGDTGNNRKNTDSGKSREPASLEDSSAFDLLHTSRGFAAFEQWYKRIISSSACAPSLKQPPSDLGGLWPQAFCPPNALPEYAFLELVRAFAECTDSEAFDFFDLMDYRFVGALDFKQVYFAVCILAASGCRQSTKLLYLHSRRIFAMLAEGRVGGSSGKVTWPRLLALLRLLGATSLVVSRACTECGVAFLSRDLTYQEFLDVTYSVLSQLDKGANNQENSNVVAGENDRPESARSKMCTLL